MAQSSIILFKNLVEVGKIVDGITGDGILIQSARCALSDSSLFKDLYEIQSYYSQLVEALTEFEEGKHTIESGYIKIRSLNFNKDPVNLTDYIKNRLERNQISELLEFKNTNISYSEYSELRKSTPTSIAVEQSFSMLGKFLSKDRKFKKENTFGYFSFYYNRNDDFKTVTLDDSEDN